MREVHTTSEVLAGRNAVGLSRIPHAKLDLGPDLAADGLAILMISSEMPEILGMSDRIAVMRAGRIRGVLDRAEATQASVLALALDE